MTGATAAIVACLSAAGAGPIVVPPIARPPLPLPMPNPTRDADVWATVLPWDTPPSTMAARALPRVRRNLKIASRPGLRTYEPSTRTIWTGPPTDRDYLRGDAWGVVMPGAPMIDGASAATPDQILSWFIDRYPLDFQKQYLAKYAGFGYTHLYLSPPDSLNGAGKSIDDFVKTCRLVRSYGLYVGVNLASKYFQPSLMEPEEFIAYLDPLLDALLDEADEFVPAWEWDLWCITAPGAITIQRHVGQRAHGAGKSCWLHFGPHTTSWFADGDPRGRFGYWDDLAGDVDGINYQIDPGLDDERIARSHGRYVVAIRTGREPLQIPALGRSGDEAIPRTRDAGRRRRARLLLGVHVRQRQTNGREGVGIR